MNVLQVLADLTAFIESDPLVKVALESGVPTSTRQVWADMLRALEADLGNVKQAARAEALASVTPPDGGYVQ